MTKASLTPAVLAEFVGTGVLVLAQVGTGVQVFALTGNPGLTLLAIALVSGLALALGISVFGGISGGHFNPAVTLGLALTGNVKLTMILPYIIAQTAGAIGGAVLANVLWSDYAVSSAIGSTPSLQQLGSEIVATAGLVGLIVFMVRRGEGNKLGVLVPVWIATAILLTPTGSLANPAVTIGRVFTDSFAGVGSTSVFSFVGAQILAALLVAVIAWGAARNRAN
ncbi:MAG: hypothetical protein RL431_18 [Actinomycetota bacterium]|jgi:glycerol uptake facilitator-like aquaporin